MTIQLDLSPELEKYVAAKMNSGEFASPSDVVRASLLSMQAREEADREELRLLIAEGIAEADRGECEPLDVMEILAEVRAEARDAGAA